MDAKATKSPLDWPEIIRQTKERLAKVLWGLEGVSEGARELALKELLWELEKVQEKVSEASVRWDNAERIFKEENELLRSLLGTGDHELRGRIIALGQEIHALRRDLIEAKEESSALRKKTVDYQEADEDLRGQLKEARQKVEELMARETHEWQSAMTGFAQEQEALQGEMSRLARELSGVHSLFTEHTDELTREKQAELSAQQARLLGEMDKALRAREELLWAEEEIFARGVAQKLRGELQAAVGRLQLTLEKFRLLEPEASAQPKTWEQWWRLIRVGPDEFRRGFQDVSKELQQASRTLEEYLALTRRRAPAREPVNLTDLVHKQMAKLYADRVEKGAVEVLAPEVLPTVQGDPELLGQVLKALLDNAFESLPKSGGRVRVKAEKSPEGNEAWLVVSDSGGGIATGARERLFEPFFTTKTGHRGLSLARTRRYAEWHRGRLELVETGPQGSVFRLALPL
jgi:signal transduction histidine kinase